MVWFAERRVNPGMFPSGYVRGLWDAVWWSVVTLTTVGYGDKVPKSIPGRSVAIVWMFSGLFLLSFFTASVTTSLTIQQLTGSISGPDDLVNKRVGSVQGSTAAKWLYADSSAAIIEFPNLDETLQAMIAGKLEAVVFDAPALQYFSSHEGRGQSMVVGPVFDKQSYGIALAEGSPHFERLNGALLRIREDGTYNLVYRKWFGD
jgi:ABC-type amino acid transport substrate-binding protein